MQFGTFQGVGKLSRNGIKVGNVTYITHCENMHFFYSSPSGQNGRYFADDIFKCIFINEKFCILIQISMKFVPKGPIDNKATFVQVMAWHRTGDKPLSEPMLTQFTHAYMGEMS